MEIAVAKKPGDLLASPPDDNPYALKAMLPQEKGKDRRLAKRHLQLLKVADPVIRRALLPGEEVFYLSDGTRLSGFEQAFIGHVVYYYNRMVFAFTTQRILLVHVRDLKHLGIFVGEISYGDLRQVTARLGVLRLYFTNGQKLVFSRMPRADAKFAANFLTPMLNPRLERDKTASALRNLCPTCLMEVTGHPAGCPHCGQPFKSAKVAALWALLFPGLGDVYLGSKFFGLYFMALAAMVWAGVFLGSPEDGTSGAPETWLGVAIVFAIMHGLDALKMAYVAKKGLFPKGRQTAPARSLRTPIAAK